MRRASAVRTFMSHFRCDGGMAAAIRYGGCRGKIMPLLPLGSISRARSSTARGDAGGWHPAVASQSRFAHVPCSHAVDNGPLCLFGARGGEIPL